MAVRRQLGVEFLKEGFRREAGEAPDRGHAAAPDDFTRKRLELLYLPPILRTLRDGRELSPRDLFREVRTQIPGETAYGDFELALNDAYGNRLVEIVGKDDVGDPKYGLSKLGLSIVPS